MMKKVLMTLMFCLIGMGVYAQEYTATSGGTGKKGEYLVNVTVSVKKKEVKEAESLVKKCAVHAVLFRGLMSADRYSSQKPLIKDPNVENVKSAFFQSFWDGGNFKNYTALVGSSLVTMKNKQTKMHEISATVMVDKESLLKYMEEQGIIQGFSNLW